MADDFRRLPHAEFIIWMENMLTTLENNNATLGLDANLLNDAKATRASLATNLSERQTLEDNLAGKNEEIKFNRADGNNKASVLKKLLKLNANASNSLIEQSGFNLDDDIKSSNPPIQPLDLVVTGTSDGTNSLKWSRNGNKQGTLFVIEAKIGDSNDWSMVDVVTNSKYEHKNQTPGVKVNYRIKAKRGDSLSTASNSAMVYG